MGPSDIIYKSEAVDISATDHTFALQVDAVYCGGAGTVVAKLAGDAGNSTWAVQAGQYLLGDFKKIIKTGTTATGLLGVRTYYR